MFRLREGAPSVAFCVGGDGGGDDDHGDDHGAEFTIGPGTQFARLPPAATGGSAETGSGGGSENGLRLPQLAWAAGAAALLMSAGGADDAVAATPEVMSSFRVRSRCYSCDPY